MIIESSTVAAWLVASRMESEQKEVFTKVTVSVYSRTPVSKFLYNNGDDMRHAIIIETETSIVNPYPLMKTSLANNGRENSCKYTDKFHSYAG
jgi:hypothetical protein